MPDNDISRELAYPNVNVVDLRETKVLCGHKGAVAREEAK
jgi:hypothetical protein